MTLAARIIMSQNELVYILRIRFVLSTSAQVFARKRRQGRGIRNLDKRRGALSIDNFDYGKGKPPKTHPLCTGLLQPMLGHHIYLRIESSTL